MNQNFKFIQEISSRKQRRFDFESKCGSWLWSRTRTRYSWRFLSERIWTNVNDIPKTHACEFFRNCVRSVPGRSRLYSIRQRDEFAPASRCSSSAKSSKESRPITHSYWFQRKEATYCLASIDLRLPYLSCTRSDLMDNVRIAFTAAQHFGIFRSIAWSHIFLPTGAAWRGSRGSFAIFLCLCAAAERW